MAKVKAAKIKTAMVGAAGPTHGTTDGGAEALIEEARWRQRRRHRLVTALLAGALLVALVTWGSVVLTSGPGPGTTGSGPAPRAVPAGAFAGTWSVHTFSLRVRADGRGSFLWPTHVACGSAPFGGYRPCDRVVHTVMGPDGRPVIVDEIIDGGRATLVLTSVRFTRARGVIEGSTQPSVVPNGPVSLTSAQHDLLVVIPVTPPTGPSPLRPGSPLCGAQARALTLSQQDAEGINCGA